MAPDTQECSCWVYKSRRREGLYLYLADAEGFSELAPALQQRFGTPVLVMELTLHGGSTLAREDPETVIENLRSQGFHLQMPPSVNPDQETSD